MTESDVKSKPLPAVKTLAPLFPDVPEQRVANSVTMAQRFYPEIFVSNAGVGNLVNARFIEQDKLSFMQLFTSIYLSDRYTNEKGSFKRGRGKELSGGLESLKRIAKEIEGLKPVKQDAVSEKIEPSPTDKTVHARSYGRSSFPGFPDDVIDRLLNMYRVKEPQSMMIRFVDGKRGFFFSPDDEAEINEFMKDRSNVIEAERTANIFRPFPAPHMRVNIDGEILSLSTRNVIEFQEIIDGIQAETEQLRQALDKEKRANRDHAASEERSVGLIRRLHQALKDEKLQNTKNKQHILMLKNDVALLNRIQPSVIEEALRQGPKPKRKRFLGIF